MIVFKIIAVIIIIGFYAWFIHKAGYKNLDAYIRSKNIGFWKAVEYCIYFWIFTILAYVVLAYLIPAFLTLIFDDMFDSRAGWHLWMNG